MTGVQLVSHKQYYDLVFRARNAKLNSAAYALEFLDWVKAGVAYNTRGYEMSSRKISYFAKLYTLLKESLEAGCSVVENNRSLFEEALQFYYEDIFEIYRDHLRAKHAEAGSRSKKAIPDFGDLYILPSFVETPALCDIFEKREFAWDNYECLSKHRFMEHTDSIYLRPESGLFRCMSMMYDYGVLHREPGVLLEVDIWDS